VTLTGGGPRNGGLPDPLEEEGADRTTVAEALGVVDARREVDGAVALRGGCRFDRRPHRPAHVAGIPGRIDDRHQVDVGAPVDVLLEWIRLPPNARSVEPDGEQVFVQLVAQKGDDPLDHPPLTLIERRTR
jgi:hypothetical protein